jgi:glycerol-3-phosphate responsive antiterminator
LRGFFVTINIRARHKRNPKTVDMKKIAFLFLAALLSSSLMNAQSKVKDRDVLGEWKLHVDLQKEIQDKDSDLNFLEKALVGAVSGIVTTAMNHVDIRFDFKRNNEVILKIYNKDEDKTETEILKWFINKQGQLEIDDLDNDHVNVQHDGAWMLLDKQLVAVEDGKVKQAVYLEKM